MKYLLATALAILPLSYATAAPHHAMAHGHPADCTPYAKAPPRWDLVWVGGYVMFRDGYCPR